MADSRIITPGGGGIKSFGDVAGGNYATFESDGTLVFYGNATTWNDINFPANSLGKTVNFPDDIALFGSGNIQGVGFAGTGTTVEQLFGATELLHDWKEGSNIELHLHWMPTTSDTGNVKWQVEYSWANALGTFGAPTSISKVVPAEGTAWKHYLDDFTDIVGTGMKIGSYFVFRLFRDPADAQDTYEADAALLAIGIHYETDTLGSRTEHVK